mgnify:CR=1 FL=1
MPRRPSRSTRISRKRTRPWAGFAFLSNGNLPRVWPNSGRAQQLSPWNPTANDLLARVVVYLGQFQEAEKLARQAIELDPLAYQARTSLARVLFAEGKLDEAEAAARKAAELQPTAAGNHRWQVFVAIQRGDGEAALREAQTGA